MSYFYLALAIAAEVAGTSLLKVTEEFTKTHAHNFSCDFLSYFILANDTCFKGLAS